MSITPLDLPAGPLLQHLQAAHATVVTLAEFVHMPDAVEAHAHHMRQVAAFTRPTMGHDFPPRPKPGQDEDGYPSVPEGWASVVMGTNTDTGAPEVLAGWTADGTFVQYAPTEAIVKVCVEALQASYASPPVSGATTATTPPAATYVDPDPGHQHGHTWRITLHSRGHYCTDSDNGPECAEPDRHADYWDRTNTVEVHASSLVGALARARELPFGAWMEDHRG